MVLMAWLNKLPRLIATVTVPAFAILAGGCMAPMASTPTGKPEVTIHADVATIKAAIIADMAVQNYTIESDSDFMLKMTRREFNNGHSDFVCAFLKQPDGATRVILSSFMTVRDIIFYVPTTIETSQHAAYFNLFQKELNKVKAQIEHSEVVPKS
jgi:hypothetical protein